MKNPNKIPIFIVSILLLHLCVAFIKCTSSESFQSEPEAKTPKKGKKAATGADKTPPASPSSSPKSPKTPNKAQTDSDPNSPAKEKREKKDFTGVRKGKAKVVLENRFVKTNNKCAANKNSDADIKTRKVAFAAKCEEIEDRVTKKSNLPYRRSIKDTDNAIHSSISYTGEQCACGAGDVYNM